ncbi:hypothetical protein HNQ36_000214 [Afipia massiliensis]|uniref:Uncharacterized protein n=1 Tax=Afipia massiliensis TaxID=211460 RepID=A0A840N0L4_9BRAD|nr:hypothetical protein [Afipia massiliensis]
MKYFIGHSAQENIVTRFSDNITARPQLDRQDGGMVT